MTMTADWLTDPAASPMETPPEGGAPMEPEPDPLAEIPEEAREAAQAYAQAQAAQAANQAREETEHRFRSAAGKIGNLKQNMAAQGLSYDDSGNLAVTDPARFAAYAQQFGAGQPAPQAPVAPTSYPDEEVGEFDDGPTISRKMQVRTERLLREQQATMAAEADARMKRLEGALISTQAESLSEKSRGFLREIGHEYLIDTPAYRQLFRQGMGQVDPAHWDNPQVVNAVAGSALALAKQAFLDAGGAPPAQPQAPAADPRVAAAQVAAAQRAGLGAIQPSRGAAPTPAPVRDPETAAYMATARSLGLNWTEEEITALADRSALGWDGNGQTAYYKRVMDKERGGSQ